MLKKKSDQAPPPWFSYAIDASGAYVSPDLEEVVSSPRTQFGRSPVWSTTGRHNRKVALVAFPVAFQG